MLQVAALVIIVLVVLGHKICLPNCMKWWGKDRRQYAWRNQSPTREAAATICEFVFPAVSATTTAAAAAFWKAGFFFTMRTMVAAFEGGLHDRDVVVSATGLRVRKRSG